METSNPIAPSTKQVTVSRWIDIFWLRGLLILALGLGIFFRVTGLGNKIYSHDEAYASLRSAGYGKGDVLIFIQDGRDHTVQEIRSFLQPDKSKTIIDTLLITARSGPHQAPLFYLLAHLWMRLVGDTTTAMRGLAALFGLLSILCMYWLSRELFHSPQKALLTTALFAISPFQILFSQDARPYSLWTLATLLSSAALLGALRTNRLKGWLLYGLTIVVGVYTHALFLLVALVHGLYFAGLYLRGYKKEYSGFLLACLLAFLAYLPWLFMFVSYWQGAVDGMDWVNRSTSWQQFIKGWALIFSSPFLDLDFSTGNLIPYLLRGLVLVLIAWGLVYLAVRGSFQEKMFILSLFVIPASAFLLPDLLIGGMRSVSGRYFVPVTIAATMAVAYLLSDKLENLLSSASIRWKLLTGLVMAASLTSNLNSLQAESWWIKELGRVRPDFVNIVDQDQTLLIVSTGQHGTTIGDVLLLSLELHHDVHFRFVKPSKDFTSDGMYKQVYWFPGSSEEVLRISQQEGLQVEQVLPETLWQLQVRDECMICDGDSSD